MIAITTRSSIRVNPEERLGSLRIVRMNSLLELTPHVIQKARAPGGRSRDSRVKTSRAYTYRESRSSQVPGLQFCNSPYISGRSWRNQSTSKFDKLLSCLFISPKYKRQEIGGK